MNRNDLRRIDMNLLVIFEALMFEKNLTRVAEKLFMGQPAVSAALGRLRDLFDDPLLLRNGRGMEPTARALVILKELQPAMDAISGAVSRAKEFDPATSCDLFRIGLGRCRVRPVPAVVEPVARGGPGHSRGGAPGQLPVDAGLAGLGEISVGVSYTTELPANAKRKKLRDIGCKVLRGDNRPEPLTLDEYCRRPHAMVSFSGDLSGNIDLDLAKVGRTRRVVLGVPQFSGLRALLAGTEMIATVPDYAACALVEGCALRAEDPPFAIEAAQLSMAWSGCMTTIRPSAGCVRGSPSLCPSP